MIRDILRTILAALIDSADVPEESISTLIARRDALMVQIARQRKAHKAVSTYEAQLRAVTLELVRRA